jgi:peptidyl-prolyl cis-trans isomerase C
MKTPDGQEFPSGIAGSPLAAAASAARNALRFIGRMIALAARAFAKFVATVWRLAEALDSALWQGVKLFGRGAWRACRVIAHVTTAATKDLARWLPSRTGRAYSAFSGVILIVAILWIIDELRVAPSLDTADRLRAPVDLEDPILARIDGRYIHLSEVQAAALASGALQEGETLTPEAAFRRELVHAYVEQRLLSRAALDEGLQRDPKVARQLGSARERVLAAAYMEERLATAVTDDAVANLYARQSDVTRLGDEVKARQIVVENGEQAEKVLAELQAGAAFGELARKYSIDRTTAALDGELGYFTRDMMAPELATAAFSTPVGEVAPPFQTEFGWHIVEVLDRRRSQGIPLDAVRDNIRRFLTLRTIEATVARLREESEVVYYDVQRAAEERQPSIVGAPGGS